MAQQSGAIRLPSLRRRSPAPHRKSLELRLEAFFVRADVGLEPSIGAPENLAKSRSFRYGFLLSWGPKSGHFSYCSLVADIICVPLMGPPKICAPYLTTLNACCCAPARTISK